MAKKKKPKIDVAAPKLTNKRDKIYKTKIIDNSDKVCVRLDAKTQVYVCKPYDIEKLKLKYLKQIKKI
jgi:hypothetical protein